MITSQLSSVIKTNDFILSNPSAQFSILLTDSRKLTNPEETLFFAIRTQRNDGANYILFLYQQGVRNFVVGDSVDEKLRVQLCSLPQCNIWFVADVVHELQRLAEYHRSLFSLPVVGITGSNGKTIVKDWIVQLLSDDFNLVATPKSYNSQIGVPLSVWQLNSDCDFAVFEAGISETGEMDALKNIIRPTIGIFTNIGQSHDENFLTRRQKIAEKLLLFTHCDVLIYNADHKDIHSVVSEDAALRSLNRYTWGQSDYNQVRLLDTLVELRSSTMVVLHDDHEYRISIPFVDRASIENAMHCVTLLFYLGYSGDVIASRCLHLMPVEMRLEMDEAINNCLLINDSYSLDINSLSIALDFIQHEQQHFRKTLILSDIVQTGVPESELYAQVAQLIERRGITKLIGIGDALLHNRHFFTNLKTAFFSSTDDFLHQYSMDEFENETILLKGARMFEFEKIAKVLRRKLHETVLEVNLDAMIHNVNVFRSYIKPTTKLMAMVKASSYGAGKVEVANMLQFNHVDYLTVAYCDEGVELRRNGISLPIMVMNPEEDSFDNIIRYNLEPDIYSFRILQRFVDVANVYSDGSKPIPIHIELDTGMHRLGFLSNQIEQLARQLGQLKSLLSVKSIFSHLAASEDPEMDDFTQLQISRFSDDSTLLKRLLGHNDICCHILNSSGIVRFPDAQMDMVRLGIGMYGISPDDNFQQRLKPVSTLKTRISQIKDIPAGDSVGYNRKWIAPVNSRIAIIPIGYADGLSRLLGNGVGRVLVGSCEQPIIGSVCMDMCFVDVTHVDCAEGDEVILFGSAHLLKQMAQASQTIPYEILTSVSPRVKRVYISDK